MFRISLSFDFKMINIKTFKKRGKKNHYPLDFKK